MDVFIVILVIVVVVICLFFVWRRLKMGKDPEYAARIERKKSRRNLERQRKKVEKAELKEKRAKYREAIAPAQSELNKAKQEYNQRVNKAEDLLRHATHDHDKSVHDQEKVISDIAKKYSDYVSSLGSMKLYVDRLLVGDTTIKMNTTFRAEEMRGRDILDHGSSHKEFTFREAKDEKDEPTEGGSLVGGIGTPAISWEIIARPDYCYLFITGTAVEYGSNQVAICVPLDDDNLDQGDEFMRHLNEVSDKSEQNARARENETAEAQAKLEEIKNDTAAIDAAQKALDQESANKEAMMAAQLALDEAKKKASEEFGYTP
ncbi:MAG: hypothetical protein ACOYIK_02770 [Coriobacteriales bacterium]